MLSIRNRKSRGSRITKYTHFTILHQAFKLKIDPLFAPLINLLKKIKKLIGFSD